MHTNPSERPELPDHFAFGYQILTAQSLLRDYPDLRNTVSSHPLIQQSSVIYRESRSRFMERLLHQFIPYASTYPTKQHLIPLDARRLFLSYGTTKTNYASSIHKDIHSQNAFPTHPSFLKHSNSTQNPSHLSAQNNIRQVTLDNPHLKEKKLPP